MRQWLIIKKTKTLLKVHNGFLEVSLTYQNSRAGKLCYKRLHCEALVIKSCDWSRERKIETVPVGVRPQKSFSLTVHAQCLQCETACFPHALSCMSTTNLAKGELTFSGHLSLTILPNGSHIKKKKLVTASECKVSILTKTLTVSTNH